MDSGTARGFVAQLGTSQGFDDCIDSVGAWEACRLVMEEHPGLARTGTGMLYSTAIIAIDVGADLAISVTSNIPEIHKQSQGYRVQRLVVHVESQAAGNVPCHVYCGLPRLVSELILDPEAPLAPISHPATLPEILAAVMETALTAMPNLCGLLVARLWNQCAYSPDLTQHHCLSYCVPVPAADPAQLPAPIWQTEEMPFDSILVDTAPQLPLRLSTMDYLCRKPVPSDVLRYIQADCECAPATCVHAEPSQAGQHLRRHLYYRPALPVVNAGGKTVLYDWCRLVISLEVDAAAAA
ncbi:hypothetical protein H4R21_004044 [Coemansia helicoidea]|uniref:Uncharacterized protein n=1 Tax=Coemansia helicoidea TaxID=1286919 RepID=A0ACC1L022_9FUNG|nr:hypothetical protein H4R21_004044 [Coemansia helicoidea]